MQNVFSLTWFALLITAFAPTVWGMNYFVTTELLPPDRPMTLSLLRALPIGLLMLLIVRQLPRGEWWWKSTVLGALNITIFFTLLFISAYRLPGGVAGTVNAITPVAVLVLSIPLLGVLPRFGEIIAGIGGVMGVGLLVMTSKVSLDMIGVLAGAGAVIALGAGVVLTKKWEPPVSALVGTTWQLIAGGILLLPITFAMEGVPPAPDKNAWIGYIFMGVFSTALAYWAWFWGLRVLSATQTAFLGLLSPLVAATIGWIALSETLTIWQLSGALIAILSIFAGQYFAPKPAPSEPAS